jgi:hypothetical protein
MRVRTHCPYIFEYVISLVEGLPGPLLDNLGPQDCTCSSYRRRNGDDDFFERMDRDTHTQTERERDRETERLDQSNLVYPRLPQEDMPPQPSFCLCAPVARILSTNPAASSAASQMTRFGSNHQLARPFNKIFGRKIMSYPISIREPAARLKIVCQRSGRSSPTAEPGTLGHNGRTVVCLSLDGTYH